MELKNSFTNWNIDSKSAKIFISEAVSEGVKKELSFSEAISLTMKRFVNKILASNTNTLITGLHIKF